MGAGNGPPPQAYSLRRMDWPQHTNVPAPALSTCTSCPQMSHTYTLPCSAPPSQRASELSHRPWMLQYSKAMSSDRPSRLTWRVTSGAP